MTCTHVCFFFSFLFLFYFFVCVSVGSISSAVLGKERGLLSGAAADNQA